MGISGSSSQRKSVLSQALGDSDGELDVEGHDGVVHQLDVVADHVARLADVLVEDVEAVDALFVVDGVADLEGVEAELHGPVEVVGCDVDVDLVAAGSAEQPIDGLFEELALEVPEGEVDAGLCDGGDDRPRRIAGWSAT